MEENLESTTVTKVKRKREPKPVLEHPSGLNHPILRKIWEIKKDYVEGIDETEYPTDPAEFLEYAWIKQIRGCTNCLLANSRTQVVKWDGVVGAPIMIVLEAPGLLEDLSAVPLVGPMELRGSRCGKCLNVKTCYSTKMLDNLKQFKKRGPDPVCEPNFTNLPQINNRFWMRSSGSLFDGILLHQYKFAYPRHNWITQYNSNNTEKWTHTSPFFITNSLLCSNLSAKGENQLPLISKCRKWLAYQYAACQPKITVSFGNLSMISLLENKTRAESVNYNEIIDSKFGPIIHQQHVASFMYERNRAIKAYNYAKINSTLEIALNYVGLPTN